MTDRPSRPLELVSPVRLRIAAWEWAAMAAIVGLAVAVRLVSLNSSLWYDEIYSLVEFVRLTPLALMSKFDSLNNHMFYNLQAQAAVAAFGETPAALRLPALVFGVASLAPIWLIARRVTGPATALVVAFLLAISYHHVWFSQNARGYTGLLFWSSAATLLFVEGLERPRWRTWLLYAGCTAAAMFTHLSAGFFFAAHGVVYLGAQGVARFRRGKPALPGLSSWLPVAGVGLAMLATIVVYLPSIMEILTTVGRVSRAIKADTGTLSEWRNPLRALAEISTSVPALGPLAPVMLFGALAVLVVGAVSLCRRAPLITAVYIVSIPVVIVILSALSFRIWPRYFVIDIGFIYLCLVHGVAVICTWLAARAPVALRRPYGPVALFAAASVVMSGASLVLLARNYSHPKQDFVGAKAFVESRRGDGDAVAAVGLARVAYGRYYAPDWKLPSSQAELMTIRAAVPALWVVVAFPYQARSSDPEIMARLTTDYDRVAVFPGTLGDGDVLVYRSR